MTRERLYLFDTTLRDGAQTTGVDFSLEDKRRIAEVLDDLGIDYVEGGYPGANATDTEFFAAKPAFENARFTAFGMTKRAGRSVSNDPGLQRSSAVVRRQHLPRRQGVGLSRARRARDHERGKPRGHPRQHPAVVASGREAMLDCEHFFDGFKGNRDYALLVARTAYEAGARWVVLCDTNGGTLPHEVERIVAEVVEGRAGQEPRHPHPQRHRERRRQHADGRAPGVPADPGHAQRASASAAATPT